MQDQVRVTVDYALKKPGGQQYSSMSYGVSLEIVVPLKLESIQDAGELLRLQAEGFVHRWFEERGLPVKAPSSKAPLANAEAGMKKA